MEIAWVGGSGPSKGLCEEPNPLQFCSGMRMQFVIVALKTYKVRVDAGWVKEGRVGMLVKLNLRLEYGQEFG